MGRASFFFFLINYMSTKGGGGQKTRQTLDQNQNKPSWFVKADVAKPCLKLSALLPSLSLKPGLSGDRPA